MIMEVAKISSKGQITIPVSVRNKLKLRTGDKIVILEENGRFYFENSAMLAFKRAEDAFAGEAQKAGFELSLIHIWIEATWNVQYFQDYVDQKT